MTYNIKIVSLANSIFTIFSLLAIFMAGIGILAPRGTGNTFLSIVLVIASLAIAYFVWQKFVTGRTQWIIDDSGISMIWIKQFAFTNNEGLNIKWSEIDNCDERSDGGVNYRIFKIKLKSGKQYKFYHDTLVTRDNYEAFQSELKEYLNNKNNLVS
jgi:hypothetical protein